VHLGTSVLASNRFDPNLTPILKKSVLTRIEIYAKMTVEAYRNINEATDKKDHRTIVMKMAGRMLL